MTDTHKYSIGVACVARGRAAIITNLILDDYIVPRYRVEYTDHWRHVDPFAIVGDDDIEVTSS